MAKPARLANHLLLGDWIAVRLGQRTFAAIRRISGCGTCPCCMFPRCLKPGVSSWYAMFNIEAITATYFMQLWQLLQTTYLLSY